MPTLIFRNSISDDDYYDGDIKCSLCKCDDMSDEMMYNKNNPLSHSNDFTSPCCNSILCPNCIIFDKKSSNIISHYLFIKSVIYLQIDEENNPITETFIDEPENIQDRWGLYKKLKGSLSKYMMVDEYYNDYKIDNFKECTNDDIYYQDIIAICICKNCKFECTARNYMDS